MSPASTACSPRQLPNCSKFRALGPTPQQLWHPSRLSSRPPLSTAMLCASCRDCSGSRARTRTVHSYRPLTRLRAVSFTGSDQAIGTKCVRSLTDTVLEPCLDNWSSMHRPTQCRHCTLVTAPANNNGDFAVRQAWHSCGWRFEVVSFHPRFAPTMKKL